MKSGRAGGRKEISRVLHMTSREYHFIFAVRIYFFFLCGDLIGNKNKSRAHLHIRVEKLERKKEGLRFIFCVNRHSGTIEYTRCLNASACPLVCISIESNLTQKGFCVQSNLIYLRKRSGTLYIIFVTG